MPKSNAPYRSKFEARIGASLNKRGVGVDHYEPTKFGYLVPAARRSYTPDWVLPNGIVVEAKGRLTAADRRKMVLVKDEHPNLDIRFVFQRASNPIRKGSNTTYGDWATANGFPWAEGDVPEQWLKEKPKTKRKR